LDTLQALTRSASRAESIFRMPERNSNPSQLMPRQRGHSDGWLRHPVAPGGSTPLAHTMRSSPQRR